MKPLFLVRGWDYSERSAGQKLLHMLADRLAEKDEMVRMTKCKLRPGSKFKCAEPGDIEGRKIIVIEPEVVGGEISWADAVVRWLLNNPGKAGIDQRWSWGKNDAIFHLCPQFAIEGSQPLSFGMIDHCVFNNDVPQERTLNCFYGRKARMIMGHVECPEGFIDLSDASYSQFELADIFRRTKKLITMDLTCCSVEALLCGAEHEFKTSSYLPEPPVLDYLSWHKEMEDNSDASLENFLDVCYKRVGLDRKVLVL
jgi:hypothetical protein